MVLRNVPVVPEPFLVTAKIGWLSPFDVAGSNDIATHRIQSLT